MSKGLKIGLIIGLCTVILIIVAVILGAVVLVNFLAAPADVANDYVKAINEGRLDTAYGYVSAKTQREETKAGFTEKLAPLKGQISKYNTRSINIVNSRATIVMDLTFTDGTRATWDMLLVKEGGDWKVDSVSPR